MYTKTHTTTEHKHTTQLHRRFPGIAESMGAAIFDWINVSEYSETIARNVWWAYGNAVKTGRLQSESAINHRYGLRSSGTFDVGIGWAVAYSARRHHRMGCNIWTLRIQLYFWRLSLEMKELTRNISSDELFVQFQTKLYFSLLYRIENAFCLVQINWNLTATMNIVVIYWIKAQNRCWISNWIYYYSQLYDNILILQTCWLL